ncbi:thiopeptide-type bacteriocin biosynthesis protein [Pedobacter sp. UYP30]|uniref:lantibiotic dehydratase n=1 Tax=Pedobacter sp. UYP30 TaxID=1756400 RepID=UPI003393A177
MKPNIHPNIIFRTPRFSYMADLVSVWEELKDAISISSASFYEIIKDVSKDDLNDLPPKVKFTIWKYFNRAKFRATPYGTFASVGVLENCIAAGESSIVIQAAQKISSFIDWPYKSSVPRDVENEILADTLVFSNSTYYKTKEGLRYVSFANNVFELSEIGDNRLVESVLDACLTPIKVSKLIAFLKVAENEIEDLKGLLAQMHELQLIFLEKDPNSIGEDYFERIGVESSPETPKYIIAQREVISANIDPKLLQHLPNLIGFVNQLLPLEERPPLANFINRFKRKFDQQEVPLVVALDPEMGVGYEDLEQGGSGEDFVTQFTGREEKKPEVLNVLKEEIEIKLSEKSFKNGETVFLNKMQLGQPGLGSKLPNTISVLLTVADDLVIAETIGGATANALAGRFTLANEKIENHCVETAQLEQKANPDVFFFDVSYLAENNVDNINRRKQIYDYQLSILNFDTSKEPLSLNDFMVSVVDSEVIIRSKRLNKRLVPRMASAYNYSRSDLSAFRLLCDLQHHKVQTSLSFSLSSVFPELNYYPRLQYHNLVLSVAKWKIKKEEYLSKAKENPTTEVLRSYLEDKGISAYFKAGLSDQTLCFNMQNKEDLEAFMQFMEKKDEVYVEEVLVPNKSTVFDETGNPYFAQFNLNLYHQEKVFNGINALDLENTPAVQQYFPLGGAWLYLEIYCHQQRIDEILLDVIGGFITEHRPEIERWFFIRYNENGEHIRLRMLLRKPKNSHELTAVLTEKLFPYLELGIVSDVQSKMYRRELERYGAENIEKIEEHFSLDSEFVLALLAIQPSDFDKYKSCSRVLEFIADADIFEPKFFMILVRQISDSFNKEHHLEAADFKKLNEQYQSYRTYEAAEINEEQLEKFNQFSQSLISVLQKAEIKKRPALLSSLLHMHVNRLFGSHQRSHEMVVYYFFFKDIQRNQALKKAK